MNFSQIDKDLANLINLAYQGDNWTIRGPNIYHEVYVFSSSNGLYFPNSAAQFNDTIMVKDNYEWLSISRNISAFNKALFLRDVHKQWYLKGISSSVNSIDKIVELVKTETNGKKLITVGTSSGGFLSTILGLSLDADMVFSFSGQLQLGATAAIDPNNNSVLQANLDSKYVDLSFLLNRDSDTYLFYFVGVHSETDWPDIEFAKRYSKIMMFLFDSDIHGVPFPPFVLKYLLKKDKHEVRALHQYFDDSVISPIFFSLKVCGLIAFIREYTTHILTKAKKKIRNFFNV